MSETLNRDPRRESSDPHVFSDYLREISNPEDIVRQGIDWMLNRGISVQDGIDVATLVLNNTGAVLNTLDSLRNQTAEK